MRGPLPSLVAFVALVAAPRAEAAVLPGLFAAHADTGNGGVGDSADWPDVNVPGNVSVDVTASDPSFQGVATAATSPGEMPQADVQGHVSGASGGQVNATAQIVYYLTAVAKPGAVETSVPVVVQLRGSAKASAGAIAIAQVKNPFFFDPAFTTASVGGNGQAGSAEFVRTGRVRIGTNSASRIELFVQGRGVSSGSGVEFQAVADPLVGIDPCLPGKDRYSVAFSGNLFPPGFPSCSVDPPGALSIHPGTQASFEVVCTDAGDTLTLASDELPTGATLTPPLPVTAASEVRSTFTWTPPTVGRFTILFTAKDAQGQTVRPSMMLDVTDQPFNRPPVADAGPDRVVPSTGDLTRVSFDNTKSTDPDGDKLEYEWLDVDGHVLAVSDFRFPTADAQLGPGRHTVTLIAIDPSGKSACDDTVIEVGGAVSTTTTSTSTTTTTTLSPLPGRISIEPASAPGGTAATVVCSLDDPSARKGAYCEAEGILSEVPEMRAALPTVGDLVIKKVRRKFDRNGRATLKLHLTRPGKKLLKQHGTIDVGVQVTIVDGHGVRGDVERPLTLRRTRPGAGRATP